MATHTLNDCAQSCTGKILAAATRLRGLSHGDARLSQKIDEIDELLPADRNYTTAQFIEWAYESHGTGYVSKTELAADRRRGVDPSGWPIEPTC